MFSSIITILQHVRHVFFHSPFFIFTVFYTLFFLFIRYRLCCCGFVFAADANYRLSFVSIGIAGLGQVMSHDAVQATQSRILWYKYH